LLERERGREEREREREQRERERERESNVTHTLHFLARLVEKRLSGIDSDHFG
jgi:hypothetical protein